jgi:uncharacterized protein YodC (DUF2158 family)
MADETPFPSGSIVRLKCGGPNMVVTPIGGVTAGPENIHCLWIDAGGQLQRAAFAADVLELGRV